MDSLLRQRLPPAIISLIMAVLFFTLPPSFAQWFGLLLFGAAALIILFQKQTPKKEVPKEPEEAES
jgi:hypothetical protein